MIAERKKTPLRLLAVLLALLVLFTGCESNSKKAMKQLQLGQKYLTEQNYTEAVASFTEVIQLAPENIPAYMGRAEAYIGLEQYDDAKADYTTVIEKTEESPYMQAQAYMGRAEVNERTEQNEDALLDYKAAALVLGKIAVDNTNLTKQELEDLKTRADDACTRLTASSEQDEPEEETPEEEQTEEENGLEEQPEDTDEQDAPEEKAAEEKPAAALKLGQTANLGGVTVTLESVTQGYYVSNGSNILEVDFTIHNGSGAGIWHGNQLSGNGDVPLEWVQSGYGKKNEFKVTSNGTALRSAQDGRYFYTTPELIANDDWGELGKDELLPNGADSDIWVYVELTSSGWENVVLTYTPSYAGGQSATFVVTPGDVTQN